MLSECFLGMTSQVLLQSKQTFQGALQRTWALLPDLLSAHDRGRHALLTKTDPFLAPTSNTTAVQKTGVPFVPPSKGQKNQRIHRQLEENNLRPRHPQYCFRLQNPIALQTSSVYPSSVKSQPSKCPPYRFRGREPSHQGGHCRNYPHKRGFLRPVIDLSFLNKFVENSHFQMESIHCLKSLLQKGDYMTTLDLKDAYLSVPVHKDSQKFLQFLWRNKCYAFQGLCFGLNTAPRIFTKLLKPVAAFLRKQGVRMILYLDDFLILGSTYQEAQSHTAMAVTLLESLGFTINQEKSCLIPTQIITFLGFVIDSTVETLSLPQEKVVKVKSLCMKATLTPTMPARQIASLLGTLEACRPAIWQAPLHFRHLQIRMIHALHANNQNFDVNLTLDHNPLEELCWWVSNIDSVNGSPIRPPAPTLFITTDASKTGWGAVCETQRTNGRWSVSERTQHINVLELKAAFLALKSFLKNHSHKVVCLRMDNTTAVAHVNNKGGTHSPCLLTLTLELWQWCLERNIMISAQHVPSRLNTIADSESRVFNDSSEWKIDSQTISLFLKGCEIDLFASRLSAQLPKYVSWRLDPEALQADALTMDWAPFKGYAFPPFNLIPAVLNKVTQDKADIILVAPIWPAQPWWPTTTEPPGQTTSSPPKLQTPPEGPNRPSEDSSNVPQTTLSRVSCLREQYQAMGIPDNVTEILLSASRSSTRKTYQSAWRRWSGWCIKRKINPLSAPLTDILLYLTEYFNSGAAYRSVNVARSAISTSHPKLNGVPVGQNPLVVQLLKGMFNNRPPKPRYSHTWEVSSVTTYLVSLGSNKSLSLKHLSWKLAMLFSLTCPERVSALTKLDLRHCHILPEGVEFMLPSPRKSGKADQLPKAFFARFPFQLQVMSSGDITLLLKGYTYNSSSYPLV